jgi:hypothetical protein
MATVKQKRVAKLIIENAALDKPLNAGEIVEKSRYSKSMVIKPSVVINSEGVQEELKALGFTEENAMNVVTEIMLNGDVEPNARLKATDQVFKVRGTYAPEKKLNVNLDVNEEHRERAVNAIRNIRR